MEGGGQESKAEALLFRCDVLVPGTMVVMRAMRTSDGFEIHLEIDWQDLLMNALCRVSEKEEIMIGLGFEV